MAAGEKGTSPRMRGKLDLAKLRHSAGRNIPAYAGKTGYLPDCCFCHAEHPCVCGENRRSKLTRMVGSGTSPRMRGKLAYEERNAPRFRNIPAYAGKTNPTGHHSSVGEEHPRVCGENLRARKGKGTSPRMRGKLATPLVLQVALRNIPAYAGKTQVPAEQGPRG